MRFLRRHRGLCAALLLLALWGWQRWDGHFTPERWAETDEASRGKLVNSLLDQYDGLVGMSQGEVEALLGPDTPGEQRAERLTPAGSRTESLLVYRAGGRPWAMFPEYLFVYLEDGRVARTELWVD